MKGQILFIILICSLLQSACVKEAALEQDRQEEGTVRFTASAGPLVSKSTGNNALEAGANVTVHAWTGKLDASSGAPALSNNYTVQINQGTDDELQETGAVMKLQTGISYFFYALSTNSASEAVPALNSNPQTVALRNGVDYLMAVADNGGPGYTASGGEMTPVPLAFRHLATQIILNVNPATTDGYLSATGLKVSIADVDPTGSYIDLSAAFGTAANPSPMIFWPGQSGEGGSEAAVATGGIPGDLPNGQTKEAVQNDTEFTVSFIILPVAGTTRGIPVKLDFAGMTFQAGDVVGEDKSYTAVIKPGNVGETLTLEGGKSYTYEVTIRRYAASFGVPAVKPWESYGVDMDKMEEVIEVDPK